MSTILDELYLQNGYKLYYLSDYRVLLLFSYYLKKIFSGQPDNFKIHMNCRFPLHVNTFNFAKCSVYASFISVYNGDMHRLIQYYLVGGNPYATIKLIVNAFYDQTGQVIGGEKQYRQSPCQMQISIRANSNVSF